MKWLVALCALALPVWAIDAARIEDVVRVQNERTNKLSQRYQEELRAAPTTAARGLVTDKYQPLLDNGNRKLLPQIPLEQQLKTREAELDAWDTQMDYWREGDMDPSVTTLTSDAAYGKGLEDFQKGEPRVMDRVMDAHKERLKNTSPR